ncbi:BglG family transcriptional antiterminator [Breznakia blatticola]|uniref:BglG family transcriptional antiterminator n=1 Tax=Breznakia blatticola TaxID=1754012 RepID=A0A4R7ZF39_9FIRM|nr:PTS sugar transporter subunit IIA [Breznakia blatticola]TDW16263.1 BglG family transcriptional antiterminator [Breznakia blatticola]
MIVLTKRQKEILTLLAKQSDYITFNEIAKKLNVSNRTIRNDMKQIEYFLDEKNIELIKKSGVGVFINCLDNTMREIQKDIDEPCMRILSKSERNDLMKVYLCLPRISTFQELADFCFVSKQTIVNDFDEVIQELGGYNISVEKIQGVGLRLFGSEIDIRKMFMQINNQGTYQNEIKELLTIHDETGMLQKKVEDIFNQLENEYNIVFKNRERFTNIILFFFLRMKHKQELAEDFQFPETPTHESLPFFVSFLTPYISNKQERLYMSTIMISERMSQLSDLLHTDTNENDEAYQISMYLVDSLQALQPLEKEAVQEMIDGLTLHLKTAIHRCRNNLQVKNDLVDQTQMMISLFYEFTRKQLHKIEKDYNLAFDENEIAYIAMYIASIYETGNKEQNLVNVLLVCSFGLATSSILKSRLSQFLPEICIIGPIGEKQAQDYIQKEDIDLIISTSDFEAQEIPVIQVNAMLNQVDIERIKNTLYQFSYAKMCSSFINSVAPAIEKLEKHYISDYIERSHIQIVDRVASWEQAIQLAAKPLLHKGYIEQTYVETMIYAVNEYGTYMVMTPETAYIHAGVDDGIYQNCTAMLVLKHPVMFGYNNPKLVRNIVILGIENKQENDLLNIAYILEKEWNIKQLEHKEITKEMILDMHD